MPCSRGESIVDSPGHLFYFHRKRAALEHQAHAEYSVILSKACSTKSREKLWKDLRYFLILSEAIKSRNSKCLHVLLQVESLHSEPLTFDCSNI